MKLEIEYDPTDQNKDFQWFLWISRNKNSYEKTHANITRFAAFRLLAEFEFKILDSPTGLGYRFELLEKALKIPGERYNAMQGCNI